MYELTEDAESAVQFELHKILAIERFIERTVPKDRVTDYAIAIYNRRRENIDIIEK